MLTPPNKQLFDSDSVINIPADLCTEPTTQTDTYVLKSVLLKVTLLLQILHWSTFIIFSLQYGKEYQIFSYAFINGKERIVTHYLKYLQFMHNLYHWTVIHKYLKATKGH